MKELDVSLYPTFLLKSAKICSAENCEHLARKTSLNLTIFMPNMQRRPLAILLAACPHKRLEFCRLYSDVMQISLRGSFSSRKLHFLSFHLDIVRFYYIRKVFPTIFIKKYHLCYDTLKKKLFYVRFYVFNDKLYWKIIICVQQLSCLWTICFTHECFVSYILNAPSQLFSSYFRFSHNLLVTPVCIQTYKLRRLSVWITSNLLFIPFSVSSSSLLESGLLTFIYFSDIFQALNRNNCGS